MLEVTDLTGARGDTTVFSQLSFTVPPGEALFVRGPNGAGKTTLLRVLAGLLRPAAGSIHWNGKAVEEDRHGIAWLGHQDGGKPVETVAQAVAFRARLHGSRDHDPGLAAMGLTRLHDTPLRELSAGQRRRVAIAGIVASGARLWLLDEPTTALDGEATQLLSAAIAAHLAAGGSAVISTHDGMAIAAAELRLGAA